MKGVIFKAVGGAFSVYRDGNEYVCSARKKNKRGGSEIIVGDWVEFSPKTLTVESVYERKNKLLRPLVANVDSLIILIAVEPQPDLLLVDKLLIHCFERDIIPYIVLNKDDITTDEYRDGIAEQYSFIEVINLSCKNGTGVNRIERILHGKTTCLAGQSATGKTSLINILSTDAERAVGGLSRKTQRGRHTTRHNELIMLGVDTFVADTAGFSLFEDASVKSSNLCLYYPDFHAVSHLCKFPMCTHINEPDCAVKNAAGKEINNLRYKRYVDIFDELKDAEKHKF